VCGNPLISGCWILARPAFVTFAAVGVTSLLAAFVPAAEVTVTRLDGTTIVGELKSFDDEQVVITTNDDETRVPTAQLVSLRWPAPPAADTPHPFSAASLVELIDGTLLPVDQLSVKESNATLMLVGPLNSDDKTLKVPVKQLSTVRFRPLEGPLAAQWDEIRGLNLASDMLVPLERDGKSLDYVEGVLGNILDENIEFKHEGKPMRVDRAKLAGIVFYRQKGELAAEPKSVIHGRSGLRAPVAHVRLSDGTAAMTTIAGTQFKWPLDDISFVDFSAGKILYLSDIEPASNLWTPLVGLPSGATAAAQYGRYRRDGSAFGGPLTLPSVDDESTSQPALAHSFNKGLAIHSRTELVYRLPAGFRRFIALAGIDPATSASGNVRLRILGDDRELLTSDIAGHLPPQVIDLDIDNVKRLTIVVDYGQNLDAGDWLNLCDARMVK